jgi:putative addiction module component (TIGR02574 family)
MKESIVSSKSLQEAALELPPDERAELAQKLLLSLDDPSEGELAEAWLSEAKRRASELDRGEVQAIDAEEVRRKARTLLR